jgi:hypothetical protein
MINTGSDNSFVGYNAGGVNTMGSGNSFLGSNAGAFNQTGSFNTVFGSEAGGYGSGAAHSFFSSTIMGYQAGTSLTTGSGNIFVGYQAGYNVATGTGNIVIGYAQDTSGPTFNNQLNIGGLIYGDMFAHTVGIGVMNPTAKLQVNGDLGLGSAGADNNQPIVIWLMAYVGVSAGDVVVAGPVDYQFNTTTIPLDPAVIGVALNSISASAWGKIAVAGVVTVNCNGGTVGQLAVTDTTSPGKVKGTSSPSADGYASVGKFLTNCGTPSASKARLLLR